MMGNDEGIVPWPSARRASALLVAAVVLSLFVAAPNARAAVPEMTQVALSVAVTGTSVAASTEVKAATPTTVHLYKVCVRSATGQNLDYNPAWRNIRISTAGSTWRGSKVLRPGGYTYFACVQRQDGSWWNGSPARFVVPGPTTPAAVTKILTIVEENHSRLQMQNGMPFLYDLGKQYAYATHYTAITHPSLPNYLAIVGGSTFGIVDDNPPSSHVIPGPSIFGQALSAGRTAKTYAESMPQSCTLTGNTDYKYAVKHNPWAYFANERAQCDTGDISSATLAADSLADRLPNVGLVVPNKCNDAHDCTLAAADHWLQKNLPPVLQSKDFISGRLAVVITGDEDQTSFGSKSTDGVFTVVLQAGLRGKHEVITTALTHYSLSRMYSQLVGRSPLRTAATATNMATAFGLTLA